MIIVQDFITLFLSIIIESLPFVVLGVLISVVIGLFSPHNFLFKKLPKNRFISHFVIAFMGVFLPVCQCGNIPVARRMMMQGFTVSQALTFLLAAPIVNPVTFLTTWEAFRLNHEVAIIRMAAGFIIAYAIGIWISYRKDQTQLLNEDFNATCHKHVNSKRSLSRAISIFQDEFILIMQMLCIGAGIAALVQVLIPRSQVLSIGNDYLLSVVVMLILGFVVSVCSTVDAFFALSFSNYFRLGSVITFLVFGPLVDIKMIFMMRTAFKYKWIFIICVIITVFSMILGLVLNNIL